MADATLLSISAISSLGGFAGVSAAYIAWQHRDHPAAIPFAKQSILSGGWGFVFAALVFVRDPAVAAVLIATQFAFAALIINYFLQFTLIYTGRGDWLTIRRRRALLAIYGFSAALVLADPFTNLLFGEVTIRTVAGLTLPVAERTGALSALTVSVAYPSVLVYIALLGEFLASQRNVYRRQTAIILLSVLFTAIGSVAFRLGLSPHPGLDLTPLFYAGEAVVIASALFYYDFLDVEPLAPDVVLSEISDPVLVCDEDGTLLHSNPAGTSLFDDGSAVGTDLGTALPGLDEAVAENNVFEHESDEDGSVAAYDVSKAPIRDQYDRRRGSAVVLRDVTMQQRRERILAELQSVNQRFLTAETEDDVTMLATRTTERTLGCPYSAILLHNADTDHLRVAAATDPLFDAFTTGNSDTPTREVTRIDGSETTPLPVIQRGENDLWQVFDSGEPMSVYSPTIKAEQPLPVSLDESVLLPLGEHGVLLVSSGSDGATLTDDDRQFAQTLASATENALNRIAKERQLRESRALIEEQKEHIEFFNACLRHDLLNGMTVIQGRAGMLDDHVDEAGMDHLRTITEYSDDIVTLTRKIRSVTGELGGQTDTDLRPVELSDTIRRKVEKIRQGHEEATIEVTVDDDLWVTGDDLLAEVVENLILNAIEHNDTSTPKVTVRTVRRTDATHVRIADNGPGIPEEMKDTVFQKGVTREASGSVGFGLYFVEVMMDRYGGSVWFEDDGTTAPPAESVAGSDEPDGTVVVLSLPAADPNIDAASHERS